MSSEQLAVSSAEAPPSLRKLSDIARAVWRVPSLDWGMVQQTEQLEHLPSTKDSRSGTRNFQDAIKQGFRVVLSRQGRCVEREGEKLRPVLREALLALGMDLGEERGTLLRKISEESALPPRRDPEDKGNEYGLRVAAWEGKLAAMRETSGVMEKLIAWLGVQTPAPNGTTESAEMSKGTAADAASAATNFLPGEPAPTTNADTTTTPTV